jgi:rubrerythrin
MGITFNADEVFQIAVKIEQNGAVFYRKAAQIVKDTQSKGMLETLAAYEHQHETMFAKLRDALNAGGNTPLTFDPEGDTARYLGALADRRVFDMTADPSSQLTGSESMKDILQLAIQAEKNSIVLYVGLQELVTEPLQKNEVYRILREEMGHVTLLTEKLVALSE